MVRKAIIFKVLGLGQYFVLLYATMHVLPGGGKKNKNTNIKDSKKKKKRVNYFLTFSINRYQ